MRRKITIGLSGHWHTKNVIAQRKLKSVCVDNEIK